VEIDTSVTNKLTQKKINQSIKKSYRACQGQEITFKCKLWSDYGKMRLKCLYCGFVVVEEEKK